jgi:hypothetical protein
MHRLLTPDANFKNALVNTACYSINGSPYVISSLEGLEYFVNLGEFYIGNSELTSIDLTNFSNLWNLSFGGNNQLTSLDLTCLVNLNYIVSSGSNSLLDLDLSTNVGLEYLLINNSNFSSITFNPYILGIEITNSTIPNLDFISITELSGLICYNNQYSELDVSSE